MSCLTINTMETADSDSGGNIDQDEAAAPKKNFAEEFMARMQSGLKKLDAAVIQ